MTHSAFILTALTRFILAMVCMGNFFVVHATDNGMSLTPDEEQWIGVHPVVRVRVANYPPYMFNSPEPAGIAVDYIKAIGQKTGVKFKFVADSDPWGKALEDVETGHERFDLLPTFTRTPEREQKFAITKDYLSSPWVIFTRRDSSFYSGLSQMEGKIFASEKGFVSTELLKKQFPGIKVIEVPSTQDALKALATGQVDGYVGNLAVASYLIRSERLGNIAVLAPTPFGVNTQAMGIRPDWKILEDIINKGIANLSANERSLIDQKWGVVEFKQEIDYEIAIEIGLLSLVILGLILYWNRKLSHEVKLRIEQQQKSDFLAKYDQLTGFPNRLSGIQYLEQLVGSNRIFTVLYIDIRNLSDINRAYGNDVGDQLICQSTKRTAQIVGTSNYLCRISDAVLMVVLPDSVDGDLITAICHTILEALKPPYSVQSNLISVHYSIGAATYSGNGFSIDQILTHAQKALMASKAIGLDSFKCFDEKMRIEIENRLQLIEDMRLAMLNNKLEIHYQPKIDLKNGQFIGVEALLRWPEGNVSTATFIKIAEECGLIIPVSRWLLSETCKKIASWIAEGHGEIHIAVNLSAAHFSGDTLRSDITHALESARIPSHLLELEITESMLLYDKQIVIETLSWLKSRQIKTYLDDFGTGYASLSYLTEYKFDYVKIDHSFTHRVLNDEVTALMTRSIIDLAHKLGILVVAEGIEDEHQFATIKGMGADIGQGYYIGKPLSEAEFVEVLKKLRNKSD